MEGKHEEARLLLHWLGASPGAVAASLRKAGIRGLPVDCTDCPLAKFLQARTGLEWRITETRWLGEPDWTLLAAEAWIADGSKETLAVPAACVAFMGRFDKGEWPMLRQWN